MPRWSVLSLCPKNPLQDKEDSSPLLGEWCGWLMVLSPPSQRRDFPVCSSFPSHIEYILFTCRESPSIQTSVIPSHKSLSSFDPPPNAFHMNAENFFLKHSPHSVHIHVEFFIFTCQIALVIYHLKKCHSSCPSMLVGLLYVMWLHLFMVVTTVFSFSFLIGGASYGKWQPHIFSFHYSAIFYPKKTLNSPWISPHSSLNFLLYSIVTPNVCTLNIPPRYSPMWFPSIFPLVDFPTKFQS